MELQEDNVNEEYFNNFFSFCETYFFIQNVEIRNQVTISLFEIMEKKFSSSYQERKSSLKLSNFIIFTFEVQEFEPFLKSWMLFTRISMRHLVEDINEYPFLVVALELAI